jgi:hypothetical protein
MGKSPVFLVANVQDPYLVASDVYTPGVPGNVTDDNKRVNIRSIYKNQINPPSTTFADIIIEEYRVQYFRTDGNPNVPEPFLELGSHLLPGGGSLNLEILVIRADAKLKSPLKELAFGGGEGEIMFTALVEFYGEDLAGNEVSTSVVIPITAKDY